jgi:putative hydrolase of the HAD superfamily
MTIRAVLFDLYDTLIYVDANKAKANRIILAEIAGLSEKTWLAGWSATEKRAIRGEIRSIEERVRHSLATVSELQIAKDLISSLASQWQKELLNSPQCYLDVKSDLRVLQAQGLKLALVSDIHAYDTEVIDLLELRDFFDALVFSCDLGICKPDPRIYQAAVAQLDVGPDECIYIGDGNSSELSGAKALGMTTVRIDREQRYDEKERDSAYDMRVKTLPEFLSWLALDIRAESAAL